MVFLDFAIHSIEFKTVTVTDSFKTGSFIEKENCASNVVDINHFEVDPFELYYDPPGIL